MPVELKAIPYWIPGHEEMIEQAGGYVHYDDWFKLYLNGQARIKASVDCYTTLGWANCGVAGKGADELQVSLPSDY